MIDNNLIDQIRHANDIVDVIESYIPLKRVGSNWRGICPFHQDTRPSMYVSQPKQIFKCFACGKGGNVYTFVQEYDKLSFIEAVKKLAARVGIVIPESGRRSKEESGTRQKLLEIYQKAAAFYSKMLFAHGEVALDYLRNRSFSPDTARELELGYALSSQKALVNHLMKEGYQTDILRTSGLFSDYYGSLQDLYRDRLIFPIHNNMGDVIAFGGRIMTPIEGVGKYINSPGTEIYTKGKELYGLYKSKYNISRQDYSLVCEGYFDFLRLYEAGFTNSVASLGTALTEDQVYLLARFSKNTTLLYDGDNAGIRAAIRAALTCISKGMQVKIVLFDENHDPDSYILSKGADALKEKISQAVDFISFMAQSERIDLPVRERINQILDALRYQKDAIQRELYISQVSEAFGVSQQALFSGLSRGMGQSAAPETAASEGAIENPEERQIITLALRDSENYKVLASRLNADYFNNKVYKDIFTFLLEKMADSAEIDAAALLDLMENNASKDILAELIFDEAQLPEIRKLIEDLQLRKLQRDLEALDRAIAKEPENEALLNEKNRMLNEYRSMTKKVVNKIPF